MQKSLKKQVSAYIVMIVLLFITVSLGQTYVSRNDKDQITLEYFQGNWKTDNGSLYEYENGAMICRWVHNPKYNGWINKSAIENIRNEGKRWIADQAIRFHNTGVLDKWMSAEIEIRDENRFIKTIKCSESERPGLCRPQKWERIK